MFIKKFLLYRIAVSMTSWRLWNYRSVAQEEWIVRPRAVSLIFQTPSVWGNLRCVWSRFWWTVFILSSKWRNAWKNARRLMISCHVFHATKPQSRRRAARQRRNAATKCVQCSWTVDPNQLYIRIKMKQFSCLIHPHLNWAKSQLVCHLWRCQCFIYVDKCCFCELLAVLYPSYFNKLLYFLTWLLNGFLRIL